MSRQDIKDDGINTQFPVNRKNHTQKHPDGYLTPILKKVLSKTYRCEDPETKKFKKIKGSQGLMQVLIWEGMQGNVVAIKEILDRLDGKVAQKLEHSGGIDFHNEEELNARFDIIKAKLARIK